MWRTSDFWDRTGRRLHRRRRELPVAALRAYVTLLLRTMLEAMAAAGERKRRA